MKIWKGWINTPHEGCLHVQVWAGSERAVRQLAKNEIDGKWTFEHVEIPTAKEGLIEWLNKNLRTDNG